MSNASELAFRRHYGAIYRFIRRRVATREAAEDLTQSVFSDAVLRLPARNDPLPWLLRVAKHRVIDEHRREQRRAAHRPQLLVARDAPAPDAPSTRALIDALECLPDGEREVVLLKLLAGWSFAEIAATVGATEPACRMRFMRGLRKLQLSLQEKGLEP